MPDTGLCFDENIWAKLIKQPLWYLDMAKFLKQAAKAMADDSTEYIELRQCIRKFFEQQLTAGNVALAIDGPNLDKDRLPIDTVVIHHTSAQPGYSLAYMESVQLLNIYAHHYANNKYKDERGLKTQAIWSGHFRAGKQTFLAYHWLMRMDGSFERLLDDHQIGWQAGNWDINKRSIAICLDNDYENHDPTTEILQKLANHIKAHYPNVNSARLIGHCEARRGTICPGTNFLDGWKSNLLSYTYDTWASWRILAWPAGC